MRRSTPAVSWLLCVTWAALAACSPTGSGVTASPTTTTTTTPSTTASTTTASTNGAESTVPTATVPTATVPTATVVPRPDWLGQRPLPTDGRGFGIAAETPPELLDRRFATVDTLAPPPTGTFEFSIAALAGEALARSTWREGCPVDPEDLAYVTVTFRGFDGADHTGELIVAASVADDVVTVFEAIWQAGFPLEEMRIVTRADLEAEPTGDGNNTAGFVCRAVTGGSGFSEHAYGLALDVNPFHNPYVKGDLVLPELARIYADRSVVRPGMISTDDAVVQAFAAVGWQWGGAWTTLQDWQHFSRTGR